MEQLIVFRAGDDTAVMAVAKNVGLTVMEIGEKDVPTGLPFWIVDSSLISDDYIIDMNSIGEPSGYGAGRTLVD